MGRRSGHVDPCRRTIASAYGSPRFRRRVDAGVPPVPRVELLDSDLPGETNSATRRLVHEPDRDRAQRDTAARQLRRLRRSVELADDAERSRAGETERLRGRPGRSLAADRRLGRASPSRSGPHEPGVEARSRPSADTRVGDREVPSIRAGLQAVVGEMSPQVAGHDRRGFSELGPVSNRRGRTGRAARRHDGGDG